jgi:hypothetical protein
MKKKELQQKKYIYNKLIMFESEFHYFLPNKYMYEYSPILLHLR